ncbi:MAG: ABC transporter ATP-binding protein [Clostridia bacterium]
MLILRNIYKIYNEGEINEKAALDDVSLTIDDGEFVAIVGKSGAGKSTLLNIIGSMDSPTRGEYILDDESTQNYSYDRLAEFRNKKIGFITQKPFLIEEFMAIDNVIIPLALGKSKKADRIEKAITVLQDVGLENQIKQRVHTMSGGEKQRVSIARALICEPKLIIADEPTGSLDSANAKIILDILTNINKSGKTVIMVTHDMEIAKQCKRIITISDGKIIADELNATDIAI